MGKSKKKKHSKAKKIILVILSVYVLAVLGVYIAGVVYYKSHFLSGSRINGIDCTGETVEEVERHVEEELVSYMLTIHERGGQTEKINAVSIGLQYVNDGHIQKLKDEQNPFLWFLSFTKKIDYTMAATTKYDETFVESVISGLGCFQEANVTKPADAYIKEGEDGYVIEPEVEGNALDEEKAKEFIRNAIKEGQTEISLEEAGLYLKPSVYRDNEELVKQKDQLNTLTSANITVDFKDRQEVIDRAMIASWLKDDEQGNKVLDEEKVKAYIVELSAKYDTFGSARQFKTSYGTTITVSGGDYGWVIARDATRAKIVEAITTGQTVTMEPDYVFRGYRREADEIGNTYVEINLTNQRMWFYKDGQLLVDTPIVSGNHNAGHDTHTGIYAIMYKERDATLKGEDYSSPVKFWMPFYANTGIHDASWRNEFGGDIYINSGSHGCINTPEANAEKIFNNIEKGVPVIVYK